MPERNKYSGPAEPRQHFSGETIVEKENLKKKERDGVGNSVMSRPGSYRYSDNFIRDNTTCVKNVENRIVFLNFYFQKHRPQFFIFFSACHTFSDV